MMNEGIVFWESHLEALQKSEQYVLASLKLIEFDIAACKKRIDLYRRKDKLTFAEALNYRPEDTLA